MVGSFIVCYFFYFIIIFYSLAHAKPRHGKISSSFNLCPFGFPSLHKSSTPKEIEASHIGESVYIDSKLTAVPRMFLTNSARWTEPNQTISCVSRKKKCVYKEMIMFIGNFMLPYFIALFLNDYHLSWCPTFSTYNYISSFENEKPEGKSKQPSYTNTYFNSNDRMTGLQRPSLNDLSVIFGVFSSLTFIILWLITPFMILVVAESGYVQSYYPVNFTSKGTL